MELTREEERMLAGKEGRGYQKAMEILVKLGEFYDAKQMVPITMAFLTKGASPGQAATEWLRNLARDGARFKCQLPMAPMNPHDIADFELQKSLGGAFCTAGASGNPRHMFTKPIFGQNLVADGTAVTHYCNSFIGARANSQCLLGQYSAAICGCTPEYGLHLTENRLGKTLFDVKTRLKDETDWSALGFHISNVLGNHPWDVPVINGIDHNETQDDHLVAFSTAMGGCWGAVVHSLVVGVSPEARTIEEAFGGNKAIETYVVTDKEIQAVYDRFSSCKEVPDMVSFGGFGINVSAHNLFKLARIFEGKKVSDKFPTVAVIDGPVKAVADRVGITDILRQAGIQIGLADFLKTKGITGSAYTNNPVAGAKKMGLQSIVFIDAKSCHYVGNQECDGVLKNLEDAAQIALTGKMGVR